MKTIYTLIIILVLASCASLKYDSTPTASSVEKLIKKHNRKPEDTAVLNRLVYGYRLLQQQYEQEIAMLSNRNTPQSWEAVANLYAKFNDLNAATAKNVALYNLLQPKDYHYDMQQAQLQAAEGYYGYAVNLLNLGNWSDAREATNYLYKVKSLAGNQYKNINVLTAQANEAATVDILIEPLRTEGIYVANGYRGNTTGERLAEQLANDLGGLWNTNGRYRAFTYGRYQNNAPTTPDWIAEPAWTYWETTPIKYNTSKRVVTKQKQMGTDSLKNPIYKTITATLTITDATVRATGHIEMRMNDANSHQLVNRNKWNESYTWIQTSATYTGDGDALSDTDWNWVRQQRDRPPSEDQLQTEILKRIYPDMLRWIKNTAN